MKKIPLFLTVFPLFSIGLTVPVDAQNETKEIKPAAPKTEKPAEPEPVDIKKASYAIGVDIGRNLERNDVDANLDELLNGIKDGMGDKVKMTDEEMRELMTAFQTQLRNKRQKKMQELAKVNQAKADEFLAKNKKEEGVVTTDSGLQYRIISEGDGPSPKTTDKVKVIYKGELIDGTVFDDSRGLPREFQANRVVRGWVEALPLMKKGAKWKLFVPPNLGYGASQRGKYIEPNSVLIFDVELVDITKPKVAVTPAVRAPLPPKKGTAGTTPRKRITAVTPPVAVPLKPKKEGEEKPKPKEVEKKEDKPSEKKKKE